MFLRITKERSTKSHQIARTKPLRVASGIVFHRKPISQNQKLRHYAYSPLILLVKLISVGAVGSLTTSTGARHTSVRMRQVPVLSSRQ